jgi:hypothetical protein
VPDYAFCDPTAIQLPLNFGRSRPSEYSAVASAFPEKVVTNDLLPARDWSSHRVALEFYAITTALALIVWRSLWNEWTYSRTVSAFIAAVLIVISINLGALRKDDRNNRPRNLQMKSAEGFRGKQADSNSA